MPVQDCTMPVQDVSDEEQSVSLEDTDCSRPDAVRLRQRDIRKSSKDNRLGGKLSIREAKGGDKWHPTLFFGILRHRGWVWKMVFRKGWVGGVMLVWGNNKVGQDV